ncbi:unnamed protein product [Calypogeia fissa]
MFAHEVPTFKLEKTHQLRIGRAFPNLRRLKVMVMNDESIREIGLIWPRLESISLAEHRDVSYTPRPQTVLETFKYLEELDANNVHCHSLASAFSDSGSLPLKSFNLPTVVITNDAEIDLLAENCRGMASLCLTVCPGLVKHDCFLKLAEKRRKLRILRLFLYLDPQRDVSEIAESAGKCLNLLATRASQLPDIQTDLAFQHTSSRLNGSRMECLEGMTTSLRSLVLYETDSAMEGISSCINLTELTFGACEGVGDLELVSVMRKCPKLKNSSHFVLPADHPARPEGRGGDCETDFFTFVLFEDTCQSSGRRI